MSGGQPRYGGILRLYGPGSMDHVDPAGSYYMLSGQIIRLFTRQLFTYPPVPRPAGLATGYPGAGHRARDPDRRQRRAEPGSPDLHDPPTTGAYWDTTPPREVTAHDFIRGFKRMCNPVLRAGAIHYYTSTIEGMAEFCDEYAAAFPTPQPGTDRARGTSRTRTKHRRDCCRRRPHPGAAPHPACTRLRAHPRDDVCLPGTGRIRRLRSRQRGVPAQRPRPSAPTGWSTTSTVESCVWNGTRCGVRTRIRCGTSISTAIEIMMEKATPEQVGQRIRSGQADLSWASPVTDPSTSTRTDPGNNLGYALNPVPGVQHGRAPTPGRSRPARGAQGDRLRHQQDGPHRHLRRAQCGHGDVARPLGHPAGQLRLRGLRPLPDAR